MELATAAAPKPLSMLTTATPVAQELKHGTLRVGVADAVDVPGAANGKGRVILFANNPIYRWQNHGEFNMVFNSIINWNDR